MSFLHKSETILKKLDSRTKLPTEIVAQKASYGAVDPDECQIVEVKKIDQRR